MHTTVGVMPFALLFLFLFFLFLILFLYLFFFFFLFLFLFLLHLSNSRDVSLPEEDDEQREHFICDIANDGIVVDRLLSFRIRLLLPRGGGGGGRVVLQPIEEAVSIDHLPR